MPATASRSKSKSKSKSKPKSSAKGSASAEGRVVVEGELVPAKSKPKKSKAKSKAKGKSGSKSKSKSRAKSRSAKPVYSARTADKYELYQIAVNSPDVDTEFLAKTYKKLVGRPARHLREDFCGTGNLMAEWLRRHADNTAEGFDNDPEPITWGIEHNFADVEGEAERARFHVKDVRDPSHTKPDVRTAPNFSWMIFTERKDLLEYLRIAREDLADDGIFVCDIYGGTESTEEIEEERKLPQGFTYVWDQVHYHPATGAYRCRIHFRFKDGTEMRNVYDYRWRLWTLPELVDVMREAGFSDVTSWWEGTDPNGVDGNGIYKPSAKGENCPAFVTYVVARK